MKRIRSMSNVISGRGSHTIVYANRKVEKPVVNECAVEPPIIDEVVVINPRKRDKNQEIPTYIVTKLFYLTDDDNLNIWDKNYYKQYERMIELCHLSCIKFMPHCKIFHFKKSIDDIFWGFQDIYYYIRDLWHSEECNILHLDADVLVHKPFDLSHIDKFHLWDFNCGVRYYPSTMSEESWKIGDFGFATYKYFWDYEQNVYNVMDDSEEVICPTVQLLDEMDHDRYMNTTFFYNETVCMCHYLSSHGPCGRLQIMEHHAELLGLI